MTDSARYFCTLKLKRSPSIESRLPKKAEKVLSANAVSAIAPARTITRRMLFPSVSSFMISRTKNMETIACTVWSMSSGILMKTSLGEVRNMNLYMNQRLAYCSFSVPQFSRFFSFASFAFCFLSSRIARRSSFVIILQCFRAAKASFLFAA